MSASLELVSVILMAAAIFVAAFELFQVILMPRIDLATLTSQNRDRITRLRRSSILYRGFEPVLDGLGGSDAVKRLVHFGTLRKYIASGAASFPFHAQELAAIVVLRSVLIAMLTVFLAATFLGIASGLLLGLIALIAYPSIHAYRAHAAMNDRLIKLVKRLPHATDLLAMQLAAGSSFRQSFSLITRELKDHALGDEFARVIRDTDHGMSMKDALEYLSRRMPNSDVKEFVSSIQASQRRGTPLAKTLGNLAEQMRVRRTQRAEKAAGKAQANITFPGLVIMGSCLLILLAPFVLQAIQENPFGF